MRAGAVFPAVSLDRDHGYTVYLNEQPEVRSGIILRKLPLDPTRAPVRLAAARARPSRCP